MSVWPSHLTLSDLITITKLHEELKLRSFSLCNFFHSPATSSFLSWNICFSSMLYALPCVAGFSCTVWNFLPTGHKTPGTCFKETFSWFNDSLNYMSYVAFNERKVTYRLRRKWKEAVVVYFSVLCWQFATKRLSTAGFRGENQSQDLPNA
jgi:hypothetical protein